MEANLRQQPSEAEQAEGGGALAGLEGLRAENARLRERLTAWERSTCGTGFGVAEVDAEGRFVHASPRLAALFGRPVEAFIGRTPTEVFRPLPEPLVDALERARVSREPSFAVVVDAPLPHLRRWQVTTHPLGTDRTLVLVSELRRELDTALRLAERDEFFRIACEAAGLGSWEYDPRAGLTRWSARHEAIYGLAPGEFDGTPERSLAYVHPDDRPRVLETIARAVASRSPYRIEYRIVRPDGQVRTLLASGGMPPEGSEPKLFGVVLDVTDQRRAFAEAEHARAEAERALADAQESATQHAAANALLEDLLAAAPVGFAVLDASLHFTRVNPALCTIDRRPAEAYLGRRIGEVLPSLAAQVEPLLRRVLETGEAAVNVAFSALTADGEPLHVLASSFRLAGDARRAPGIGLVVVDVTAQRREQLGRALLERTTRVLASSLDGDAVLTALAKEVVPALGDACVIDLVDDDGRLRRMPSATHDPALAPRLDAFLARVPPPRPDLSPIWTEGPILLEEVPIELAETLYEGLPEEDRAFLRSLPVRSALAVPLVTRDRPFGMVVVAVSPPRRLDAFDLELASEIARRAAISWENARLYRDAREATRARDDFLSVASHELRTPIAALSLELQSLGRMHQKRILTEERLVAKIKGADRHIRRITALVEELLDISKLTAGRLELRPEPVDLAAVAREAVGRFTEADSGPRVEVAVDPVGVNVVGRWDRLRLDQVVTNLVSNAVKYGEGRPVEVRIARGDDEAVLAVRDQGIGIAPDQQRRLFQRFERLVGLDHPHGFGLGLWIVREIVTRHGGSIGVESEVGVGTTFTVRLPLTPKAS